MQIKTVLQPGWDGTDWVWAPFPWTDTLDEAKSFCASLTNQTSYNLLVGSDWMVVRQSETGTPVAPEWGTWRETIRKEAESKNAAISAATSKEELNSYTQSPEYETWTDSPSTPG